MRCDVSWEKLSMYSDGFLSDKEARELKSHIEGCGDCRQNLELIRKEKSILKNLTPQEESADFDRAFAQKLQEAEERSRYIYARPMMAGVFATIAVVLVFVFLLNVPGFIKVDMPTILAAKGSVERFSPAENKFVALRKGDRVEQGELFRAGQDGEIDLMVKNKYVFKVKPNSKVSFLSINRFGQRPQTLLDVKEGQVIVRTDEGFRGSQFLVSTPVATTKDIGTVFMVDVNSKKEYSTSVAVLTGAVEVKSRFLPAGLKEKNKIDVKAGHKTSVSRDSVPTQPQKLHGEEWQSLQEIYGLGRKLQVALIISNKPDRIYELLKPCPLYISDEELKIAPDFLKEIVNTVNKAAALSQRPEHLKAIKMLEEIINTYKDKNYSGQLLLFIGSYYRYIDEYDQAIRVFENITSEYKERKNIAGLAQCAIGVIYEKDLKDPQKAREAYLAVVKEYPWSPEAVEAKLALGRLAP